MAGQFVWFNLSAPNPGGARDFYASLLGWDIGEEGMVAGENGPWAAVGAPNGSASGWVPYVQVDDVDQATERARELGAKVLQQKTRGPAGEYTTIADPAGAAIALWSPGG